MSIAESLIDQALDEGPKANKAMDKLVLGTRELEDAMSTLKAMNDKGLKPEMMHVANAIKSAKKAQVGLRKLMNSGLIYQ